MSTYDYIVIGAGSSGAVVAARLSEDPTRTVLLLEAGGRDERDTIMVPPAWPANWRSDVDYDYVTVPQLRTPAEQHWPRGKVLGGSSSINGLIWLRGRRSDFDAWQAGGATGWGYDDVLPFFQASETVPGGNPAVRGTSGPMRPAVAEHVNALTEAYIAAAVDSGHPAANDFNGDQAFGAGLHELSIDQGRRQSVAVAYLREAEQRPNLTVITGARADRLVIDGAVCTGVTYTVGDRTETAAATAEVIVSAGVIGTPQLLKLSGIGPAAELEDLGIDVVVDAPEVGENLQDHLMTGVTYEATGELPPSINNHGEASMLLPALDDPQVPELQFLFILVPLHPPVLAAVEHGYTLGVALVRPRSKGTVRLASSDPRDAPLIDPRYLSDERDAETLVRGIRVAREIGASSALDQFRLREVHPGPDVTSDEELHAFLAVASDTYYHPHGTARMGSDDRAVVTPDLRVRGVDGLRVADASVFPSLTVNTNATCIMIGERLASMLTSAR